MSETKIVIISDSHGNVGRARKAIEQEKPFDILVHCGDLTGSLSAITRDDPDFQVYAVCGNCDGRGELPEEQLFQVGKKTVWVTHGHNYRVKHEVTLQTLRDAAAERNADIVLYGHTHHAQIDGDGMHGTLLLNPGTIGSRPRYLEKNTYAVLTIAENGEVYAVIRGVE